MRVLKVVLVASIAILATPAQAGPKAVEHPAGVTVKPLAFTERTLPNGLRVYAIRDTSSANVAVHVWYNVGSKDDPKGRSGFAHLFEHLMFKATRNLPPETFDRLTEDVGGFNNASTNDDYTNYFETVPANHLERILFAEADRMASLVIDPASFKSERDVVKEEYRARVLADPYGKLFSLYLPEISYVWHPYARPGIGSLEDLDAASIEDVRTFHATYYRPDNAVLVVAGNFDPAQLDQWVNRYFAPIARPSAAIPRVTVAEPARTKPINRTVYADNLPLPAVLLSFQLPPDNAADTPALAVLATILATGDSSRLYQSLVYREQVAAQVGSFLDTKQGTGALAIYAIVAGGKSVQTGEAGIRRELSRLRTTPVTAEELKRARNQILTHVIESRETPDGKASALAEAVIIDGNPRAADAQIVAIQRVTAADVLRVARRYLQENQAASLRLLPKTKDSPAGDKVAVSPQVVVHSIDAAARVPAIVAASEAERRPLPPPAAPQPFAPPSPVETRLDNGLRVVSLEKHDLPLVSINLVMPGAGSGTDGPARAGLAALTADLLTKGTSTRSAEQIARAIEALGGTIAASVDRDGATLGVTVKADQVDAAMAILADVAQHPAFSDGEIKRAVAQRLDGIQVALNDPGQLAGIVAARTVYGDGPYGTVADGTPATLARFDRATIAEAYASHWRPDQGALVIAGDITPHAAEALTKKYFGGWQAGSARPSATPPQSAQPQSVVVIDQPGAGQAAVIVAGAAIARSDPRYYASAVANSVLGGGYSSRLNLEVRIRRGLSYGAGSSLDARRMAGPLTLTAQTKNESAPEVASLMFAELKRLQTELAPKSELAPRKEALLGSFARTSESVSGLAGLLSGYVIDGVPTEEIKRYAPEIQKIDASAVNEAAKTMLSNGIADLVIVGDLAKFRTELLRQFPDARIIPFDKIDLDRPDLIGAAKP